MAEESGEMLPSGEVGEIVIRGANVTDGYIENPAANATAFTDGWFRTGDQGVIDGEDVAAAVVLCEGVEATERELRDFVSQRLADFKVPRKMLFLEEIPKGATGKLQRIGLAEKLGLG